MNGIVYHSAQPERNMNSRGPSDFFEISSNNSPDEPDEEDDVYEPQDYTGDYPLEGDDGEDED
jgi:hypothetical protein